MLANRLAAALALCLCSGSAWALPVCERSPEVRRAIVANACIRWATSCEDVDTCALAGIRRMLWGHPVRYFSGRRNLGISSLKAGDFDGLVSLWDLGLHDNDLTARRRRGPAVHPIGMMRFPGRVHGAANLGPHTLG